MPSRASIGLSSQPEIVAETPGFQIKSRAMPLQPLYRTITQYKEVSVVLENNNGSLTQLSVEGLLLVRSLLASLYA